MSAWMQGLLLGFALGALFGLGVALALVRVEAHRNRRPGYLTPQQPSWLRAQLEDPPRTSMHAFPRKEDTT